MLWHKLTEVATMWRDVARVNCQLEAKLTVSRLSAYVNSAILCPWYSFSLLS